MSIGAQSSIFLRLAGLIGAVQLVAVGALAGTLAWRGAQTQTEALQNKAATYGGLVAEQVRSAVAFDDQETAREIFDAVARDRDVEALALYTEKGPLLYGRGDNPPTWSERAPDRPLVVPGAGVLTAVAPVVSAEGPRGTLVLRLSTEAVKAGIQARVREALGAAVLALALSVLAAGLIARRLSRRIGRIARAAEAVAGGDLGQPALDDHSGDELGVLARGFDVMVRRLRSLVEEMRANAEHEQERLGALVQARTVELDARNQGMRRVLDAVEQGLVLIDREGNLSSERSAALDRWFAGSGTTLWSCLSQIDPHRAALIEVSWGAVVDGMLPEEVTLAQIPTRLAREDRTFDVRFSPTHDRDGALTGALVVITDISESVARERAEADERETMNLLARLIADREGVLDMLAEAAMLMATALDGSTDRTTLLRALHTLKGNGAQFGLNGLASTIHAIEARLGEESGGLLADERERLSARWSQLSRKVAQLVDTRAPGEIRLDADEVAELRAVANAPEVIAVIERWSQERIAPRLERAAAYARALAARLDQPPLEIELRARGVRAPHAALAPVWPALTHVIRNAVDHGSRPDAGGRLVLEARRDASGLALVVRDHGPGVAWAKVREKARARGLPHSTQAELIEALFDDGLTTRDAATEISGRGVGLAAVRAAISATGGTITVESDASGTAFRFHWPTLVLDPASPAPHPGRARPTKGASA